MFIAEVLHDLGVRLTVCATWVHRPGCSRKKLGYYDTHNRPGLFRGRHQTRQSSPTAESDAFYNSLLRTRLTNWNRSIEGLGLAIARCQP